jgi:hypothetical protein
VKALVVAILVSLVALVSIALADKIAIVDATVIVKPGQRIEHATVVIDGNKITAVGTNLAAPAGAKIIDGKTKIVTAGLIESISGVGLVSVDLEASSVDGRFSNTDPVHDDPVHASYDARDGFAPRDVNVPIARTGGITTIVAAPSGALVAGQSAAFALDGGTVALRAPAAMHVELGSSPPPSTRGKALELLREILDDARSFGRDRAGYERNQKRRMIADRLDLEALQPRPRRPRARHRHRRQRSRHSRGPPHRDRLQAARRDRRWLRSLAGREGARGREGDRPRRSDAQPAKLARRE